MVIETHYYYYYLLLLLPGSVSAISPVIAVYDSNVTLQCNYTGYLPANYTIVWSDGTGPIDSQYITEVDEATGVSQSGGRSTNGGIVSILTLHFVDVEDSGSYTCAMTGTELKATVSLQVIAGIVYLIYTHND